MRKFISPALFAAIFTVTYAVVAIKDWTIFYYYPLIQQVSRTKLGAKSGPSMHWYAWIVTALIVSGVLSALVSRRWTRPLDRWLAWIPAVFAVIAILIFEKKWFV